MSFVSVEDGIIEVKLDVGSIGIGMAASLTSSFSTHCIWLDFKFCNYDNNYFPIKVIFKTKNLPLILENYFYDTSNTVL